MIAEYALEGQFRPRFSESDMKVISHLRKNSRKKVTEMSRDLKIPVTTLYDKIRAQEKKGIINKHTTLLNFNKLGFFSRAILAITVGVEKRKRLKEYLMNHPRINSLYRIDSGHDFMFEVIFENPNNLQDFIDETQSLFSPFQFKTFHVLQDLKKEAFMDSTHTHSVL